MQKSRKDNALSYNDEVLNELYDAKTLVKATKTYCLEKEFNGQYYGIPNIYTTKISEERNEFISLLGLISEKLVKLNKLNRNLEKELTDLQ